MRNLIYVITPLLLIGLIGSACSNINQKSQEHHAAKKKMRHGILPLSHSYQTDREIVKSLDQNSIKRGEKIYQHNCYICHGAKGQGQGPESYSLTTPPQNLVKVARQIPNFKFYMKISQWQGKMPGWKSALSDKDLEDVKAYILYLAYK